MDGKWYYRHIQLVFTTPLSMRGSTHCYRVHFILVAIKRDTTDQMMSCRIELTFAASVAAFMCFVLYLFYSAIELHMGCAFLTVNHIRFVKGPDQIKQRC